MTEDYKKSLIDYVSGLLKIEQQQPEDFDPNEHAGIGADTYTSNDWSNVISALSGKSAVINGILDNENYDNYIMYGGYQEGNSGNCKGFLIYINQYNKPTRIRIMENARGFQCLKFDEVNNRVYGVYGDRAYYTPADDNDAYFVYYNNLFLTDSDTNPPVITYSYKIHSDSGTDYFMVRDIIKHPERPFYIIYSTNFSNLSNVKVSELKINVGSSNDLVSWSLTSDYLGYAFYGKYSGETPNFKIISYDNGTDKKFKLVVGDGTNLTYTNLTCDSVLEDKQTAYVRDEYISLNDNTIYFVYNATWNENAVIYRRSTLLKYDGTTTLKTLYKTDAIEYDTGHRDIPMLNIVRDVNTIYCVRAISNEAENNTSIKVVNISEHNNPQESDFKDLGTSENTYVYRFNMYNFRTILKRNYNIIYFNSYSSYMREGLGSYSNDVNGFTNQAGRVKQRVGYTGYPYSYYNVLVPRYVNLYYAGVALMFSRNVYNITTFNNTTTASVEVPAKYLNNLQIGREKLFGITGYELVRENRLISKNQYEVLHINYINTINVWDEDRDITYKLPAIKVNTGITTGTQQIYENTRCTKYRINYQDNSESVSTITWNNINDLNKQTYFVISVSKAIKNIELISNDETTTYMVINGSFEVGKDYLITQKVRIGEKPISNDLQYNGENILYGNQQVKVYTQ